MSSNVSHRSSRGTQSWVHLLMRSPAVITSPAQRAMTTVLILIGGLLTIVSGVIHLYLWGESNGYRLIPAIGPLFLAQGIAAS